MNGNTMQLKQVKIKVIFTDHLLLLLGWIEQFSAYRWHFYLQKSRKLLPDAFQLKGTEEICIK